MTARKTADPFIKTNEEYMKLRGEKPPREQVSGELPLYERWTEAELRRHAESLGMDDAAALDRQALIDRLYAGQSAR